MSSKQREVAVPLGSLIAVTGANGLVGSFVVDELLKFGYRVRGTVRDANKHEPWMTRVFGQKYGHGKLEIVEVKDLGKPDALDGVLEECSGVAHVASDLSFGPDPHVVVNNAIEQLQSVLNTTAKHPSIKRFVMTSSSSACSVGNLDDKTADITAETWNEESVKKAWAPPPYDQPPDRAMHTYAASKTQAEQFLYQYAKENHALGFQVNSVLPDLVTGAPFAKEQGYPSSCGMIKAIWDGSEMYKMLAPQYMVDGGDVGRMHVAAIANPEINGERIFGYGHHRVWSEFIAIFKKIVPEHQFPDMPAHEEKLSATITARPRAEEILRWVDGRGFRPMEESVQDVGEFLKNA